MSQPDTPRQDRGMTSHVGSIEINWPQTVGYYGGIALAVAFELIEPPLGIFIAAIPLLKLLNRPNNPLPPRVVSQLLQGAAKPVGGDAESTIRVAGSE